MDQFETLRELNPAALTADGFDAAYLGYVENPASAAVAVYGAERCIQILIDNQGMTHEEATEYFEFNVTGAYVGPHTPLFLFSVTGS
jgi:hypothetical protein